MKTVLKYSICFVILLFSLACQDALNEEVKTFFTEDTFYQTEQDARLAINGIYGHLGANFDGALNAEGIYFANYWTANALLSDEGESNGNFGRGYFELSTMTHTPQNNIALQIWSNLYLGINAANLAIANIPDINMNADIKDNLLGEAYFLRGLLYFELVRFFGEVPLQLVAQTEFTTNSYLPRSTEEKVYNQILSDLSIAENTLPSQQIGVDNGRPTSWSAKAYTAKAALQQGVNLALAQTKLEDIINGPFGLWQDYADVFKISNNNGKEVLFSISFLEGSDLFTTLWEGGHLVFRTLPNLYGGRPNGQGFETPTQDLYDSFDDLDRRKEVTFLSEDVIDGEIVDFGRPYIVKYWDRQAEPEVNNTNNDLQLIRFSDILLMYAEVINELNNGSTTEALVAINRVRRRARFSNGVENNVLPNLTAMGYQDFKDAILLERRKELAWEGHRWFDLVRFGKLQEKVSLAKPSVSITTPRHNLLPIPQRERDLNPSLTQNLDY
tara:strand:- start:187 stop:1683 length:1497 start_codon:yes stop_codon:yes gene_type:complete